MEWILVVLFLLAAFIFFRSRRRWSPRRLPLKIAPIIEERSDIQFDQDYRKPGDPEHYIRLKQKSPKGISRILARDVAVVGISRPEQRVTADYFMRGKDRRLELKRDPSNQNDPNAIAVIAHWNDPNNEPIEHQIGWVPRDAAKEIAEEYPDSLLGAKIFLMFQSFGDNDPGIRFDLLGER